MCRMQAFEPRSVDNPIEKGNYDVTGSESRHDCGDTRRTGFGSAITPEDPHEKTLKRESTPNIYGFWYCIILHNNISLFIISWQFCYKYDL